MSSKSRRAFLYVLLAVMVVTQAAYAGTGKDDTSEESVAVLNEDIALEQTEQSAEDSINTDAEDSISQVIYVEEETSEIIEETLLGGISDSGESEYQDMIVSYADPYLPVREEPTRESSTIGKMMPGSYAYILECGDEWTKVESGNVVGYVQNIYVCFDDEAADLAEQINKTLTTALTLEEEKKQLAAQKAANSKITVSSTSASDSDLYLLAAIIDWEANNESYEGKLAVGYVIMNRINAGYGASISAVLLAKGQFGGVSDGSGGWSDKFQSRINKYAGGTDNDCLKAARDVLAGANCPLNAAYLHFNTSVSSYSQAQQIGNHIFYN
jgi:hypothetical protein